MRFQAYDILRLNGEDLRQKTLGERRQIMEEVMSSLPNDFPIGVSDQVREKIGLDYP